LIAVEVILPPAEYIVVTSPVSLLIDEDIVIALLLVVAVDNGYRVSPPLTIGANARALVLTVLVEVPDVPVTAGAAES
jgi:hypothetical protein